MKSEVKNLVHRTSLLETSQNDGEAKMNQMEKDLSEQRLIAGNIKFQEFSVYYSFFSDI